MQRNGWEWRFRFVIGNATRTFEWLNLIRKWTKIKIIRITWTQRLKWGSTSGIGILNDKISKHMLNTFKI